MPEPTLLSISGFHSSSSLFEPLQIKNLAADLCLDRALVLQLLRDPPPNLLMMSLTIPDEPATTAVSLETKPGEILLQETSIDQVESEPEAKVPVHTLQRNWYAQKRLKKAHVDTLERVYRRSKRPTVSTFIMLQYCINSISLFHDSVSFFVGKFRDMYCDY